jgi:hypothetical protein
MPLCEGILIRPRGASMSRLLFFQKLSEWKKAEETFHQKLWVVVVRSRTEVLLRLGWILCFNKNCIERRQSYFRFRMVSTKRLSHYLLFKQSTNR